MSEPAWVGLGGGEIDYVGDWSGATAYLPGQIVRYNGVDYLAVNPSVGQTPPTVFGPVGAGYGTILPASPIDGQEYTLVDSLTNPSYQWRFRWNAGSSSAYKWEFVGGTRRDHGDRGGVYHDPCIPPGFPDLHAASPPRERVITWLSSRRRSATSVRALCIRNLRAGALPLMNRSGVAAPRHWSAVTCRERSTLPAVAAGL